MDFLTFTKVGCILAKELLGFSIFQLAGPKQYPKWALIAALFGLALWQISVNMRTATFVGISGNIPVDLPKYKVCTTYMNYTANIYPLNPPPPDH